MKADRLNAFTDGVIAIIITIMVLEIRLPEEASWDGFLTMAPFLGIYGLSFVNVGIFWNNHHHMLHASTSVTGAMLWLTSTCCFGFRYFRSPLAGWEKTILRRCPLRSPA